MRRAMVAAALGGLVLALLGRWLSAPVAPAAPDLVRRVEGVAGAGSPAGAFVLLYVQEVVWADAPGLPEARGAASFDPDRGVLAPPPGQELPAGARVVVLYEARALDRLVLSRLVALHRLPGGVRATRHLRRLVLSAGGAKGARFPLRVLGLREDGTLSVEVAGARAEIPPGEGWGLGWAEGTGVRRLPADGVRWREAVGAARRRGEVVTSLSLFNHGWWSRPKPVPDGVPR